jgi:restriction system protein
MTRRKKIDFDLLAQLPWWVSVSLAIVTFSVTHFVIPNIEFTSWVYQGLAKSAPGVGKMFSLFFLFGGLLSIFVSWNKRRQLDSQTGINSIRALSWKQFEELVGEAYRRQGYNVAENSGAGPDGGVDLFLKKNEQAILVQCKQWRSQKVGVKIVRELFGVMTAAKANRGIIVTCGYFTPEAMDFASGKPIELVGESALVKLIQSVQDEQRIETIPKPVGIPNCPQCKTKMVLRTAKRGRNAGTQFWGCSDFPKCRSIVAL